MSDSSATPARDASRWLHGIDALRTLEARAGRAAGGADALMQRAGLAAWHALLAHWPQSPSITVVCGPGNNGGDGDVLAAHAHRAGRRVVVVRLPDHQPRSEQAVRAARSYAEAGGSVVTFDGALPAADLIVDALFGIGLSRAPDGAAATLIEAINASHVPVFALDVPSGIDADTGNMPGVAVRATRTLQFIAGHPGLSTGDALGQAGALEVATLDIDAEHFEGLHPAAIAIGREVIAAMLPPRRRNAHKGDSGRVLCIGGDHGKGGAIALSADAALRAGAGLVDVATRSAHVPALLARRPELMTHAVESADALTGLLASASVIAIGPGLGQASWGQALLAAVLATSTPLVIDADALNLVAAAPRKLPPDTILTPHPGEAARLLSIETAAVQRDRHGALAALCARYGCVVVLKGAGTLVGGPGETTRIIDAGNPGMAVGGMGDLLTGVIAALRAQRLSPMDAASLGALIHGLAGDDAAADGGQRGLLPTDLLRPLRRLVNP